MKDLLASLALSLRAKNRSPKTIHRYLLAAEQLATFLGTGDLTSVTKAEVERFISHCLQTKASATAAQRNRSLQQFYRWLEAEGEVALSPMARLKPPTIQERPVSVITDDAIRAAEFGCRESKRWLAHL